MSETGTTGDQVYDAPPFRPPNEADSALIRVTRGCPWNRCAFCAMYRRNRFEVKPIGEIREDVRRARELYGPVETVFLGDSDNLVHNRLAEVAALVRNLFPEARRITSYARARTIVRRSPEYLSEVRRAGLDRLHIGLESGDGETLKRLAKGADPKTMIRAGRDSKCRSTCLTGPGDADAAESMPWPAPGC